MDEERKQLIDELRRGSVAIFACVERPASDQISQLFLRALEVIENDAAADQPVLWAHLDGVTYSKEAPRFPHNWTPLYTRPAPPPSANLGPMTCLSCGGEAVQPSGTEELGPDEVLSKPALLAWIAECQKLRRQLEETRAGVEDADRLIRELTQALRHLAHNARASGAEMENEILGV